jgi:hypothetical protein
MLLYHGSNIEVAEPRLLKHTRGLDFGQGFYLSVNQKQAATFSERVLKRSNTGVPTVSTYEFNEAAAKHKLDMLLFPEPNAEWLAFVKDNRLKAYSGQQYDVIGGPVANDNVFPTIQALVIGQFTIEAALVALKPFKLFDQYCFATEKALSELKFVNSTTTWEGR